MLVHCVFKPEFKGWKCGIRAFGRRRAVSPIRCALVAGTRVIISNPILFYFSTCSVFWDLYCAAPERRDTCEHSSEAKAFHDYVSNKFLILAIITGLDSSNFFSTRSKYTAIWQWSLFSPGLFLFCPPPCCPCPVLTWGTVFRNVVIMQKSIDTYLEDKMVVLGLSCKRLMFRADS